MADESHEVIVFETLTADEKLNHIFENQGLIIANQNKIWVKLDKIEEGDTQLQELCQKIANVTIDTNVNSSITSK